MEKGRLKREKKRKKKKMPRTGIELVAISKDVTNCHLMKIMYPCLKLSHATLYYVAMG